MLVEMANVSIFNTDISRNKCNNKKYISLIMVIKLLYSLVNNMDQSCLKLKRHSISENSLLDQGQI